MALRRPKAELESDLSELESFYTPSGSASSLSPSPTPGLILDEVYTVSPAPMPYGTYRSLSTFLHLSDAVSSSVELPYDLMNHSALASTSFHGSYTTSSSVDGLAGLPTLFEAMPYTFDASCDEPLLLSGPSSLSSSPDSSVGMVSWDVDLTSFSTDRGCASLPPLYDC